MVSEIQVCKNTTASRVKEVFSISYREEKWNSVWNFAPKIRRNGVVFPGKRKSYKPCLAEFFFAIFNGDIGAGVSGVKPANNWKVRRELPALIGTSILLSPKYQEFVARSGTLKISASRRLCKF